MDLGDRLLRSAIVTAAAVVAGLLTRSMVKGRERSRGRDHRLPSSRG